MGASRGIGQRQNSGRETHPAPGATVIVGVFVALLILFFWLHFIVAHENELIGREIQVKTAELAHIERENMALRQQIAAGCAEPAMAERARALGYRPQQPLYLLLNRPLVPAAVGSRSGALLLPSIHQTARPGDTGADSISGAAGDGSPVTAAGRP